MTAEEQSRPHLRLRGLRKLYGSQVAVDGVDLDIRQGEFVALLGPSGCGKTTLLRSIAGLVTPSAGDILIDSRSVLSVPVYRRDLGMVFQSYALFPHMTVAANVAFGLRMRRVAAAEQRREVARALDLVRMQGFEARYPAELSGGQQQRVALARALVTNPAVLLLDEPLAALDAKLREAMQVELRRLQRSVGVTTLFVTHDQHEALGMADRIAVMRAGRVEQFDTPSAIYETPRTPFVAEFVGQTNRMTGELIGHEDGVARIRLDGLAEPFSARPNPDLALGRCLAMLRPEKLEIRPAGADRREVANRIAGRIAETLFAGEKITLYVETPLGLLQAAIPNKRDLAGAVPEPGVPVEVGWRAEDALIFPDEPAG